MRRMVRSVSCNVGSDQLFDQLSRWHLQRGGSVEITSRGLSVHHTTSCCFLKTFCSTCPSGLSERCTSRTPSRLTESCVPGSSNYELLASQTHFNTIPLCYYPLLFALPLSAAHWLKEDVCAVSFSSKKMQCIASRRLYMLPLWLFKMSTACNPIQKQYTTHIETTYL